MPSALQHETLKLKGVRWKENYIYLQDYFVCTKCWIVDIDLVLFSLMFIILFCDGFWYTRLECKHQLLLSQKLLQSFHKLECGHYIGVQFLQFLDSFQGFCCSGFVFHHFSFYLVALICNSGCFSFDFTAMACEPEYTK